MKSWLKKAISGLYDQGRALDKKTYEWGLKKKIRTQSKILSVGNLTVGGTGKTPIVCFLLKELIKQNLKVALVSRSYRASAKAPIQVDPNLKNAAAIFGDEATLIASEFREIPVWVGAHKGQVALALEEKLGIFDWILVDDGFQHWSLERDFDLVLIDPSDEKMDQIFPLGTARESFQALDRASAVVLTKINWATSEQIQKVRAKLSNHKPLFEAQFLTVWPELSSEVESLGVFSALARSEVFTAQVRQKYFPRVKKIWQFSDHHPYNEIDLEQFRMFLKNSKSALVTTAKDAIKLNSHVFEPELKIVRVEAAIAAGDMLFEKLRNLVR